MKSQESVISKIWRKLFPREGTPSRPTARPVRLDGTSTGESGGTRKSRPGGIEMLEGRIAPAYLLNPSTLVYTDVDGDQVMVKFSKNLFKQEGTLLQAVLNSTFKFDTGGIYLSAAEDPGTPQQLQLIELTKIPTIGFGAKEKSPAAGVSLTVIAEKAGDMTGDGFANVGAINAVSSLNSFGLGKVTIDGDLGQIDAGTAKTAVGLKALHVHSLGAVSGTQASTGAGTIESKIIGKLGSLTVDTEIKNASIYAASGGLKSKAVGKIGNITIGVALHGNETVSSQSNDTGLIRSDTTIGKVKIGSGGEGHGIIGGGGTNSGSIIAGTKLTSITVNGSVVGGGGQFSGSIFAVGHLGNVKVTGDVYVPSSIISGGQSAGSIISGGSADSVVVDGNLKGGVAANTGVIVVEKNIGSIVIGGDVVGGGGPGAGGIEVRGAKLGKLTLNGDLIGGSGNLSGYILGYADLGNLTIRGDIVGNPDATGEKSGIVTAYGSIKKLTVGGSLLGGKGASSGVIQAALGLQGGTLGNVTIGGLVSGGEGEKSGAIISDDKIGKIVVNGVGGVALQGKKGTFSGSIYSAGKASSVKLLGSVVGGDGNNSGTVTGLLNSLSISGDVKGGLGAGSGSIQARDDVFSETAGDLGKITISGSLLAGIGARSGAIYADGNLKSVVVGAINATISGSGTAGAGSAGIFTGQGLVNVGDAGSIRVLGSINGVEADHTILEIQGSLGSLEARTGIANGEIRVGDRIGSIKVGVEGKKGVEGNLENVLITAGGLAPAKAKQAVSIASIIVNGDVVNSEILAGYDIEGDATNSSAQIGKVKVTGDWKASSLVAGIAAVNGHFGDADDQVIDEGNPDIASRIASVLIGGSVSGTNDSTTDHFGFVAQKIGTFKVGGVAIPGNDLADDVKVRVVTV